MKVTSKARSTSLSRQIQHLYLPEVRSSQEDRAAEKETANIEQSESEPRNLQKRSLVPRPLPVFQCCTLKNARGPGISFKVIGNGTGQVQRLSAVTVY